MPWDEDQSTYHQPEPEDEPDRPDGSTGLSHLIEAFHAQLLACLEECAAGRRGLFSDLSHLDQSSAWPEAASLRQLAFALQSVLAQNEASDTLCDQFLDLCSIHGEADPGEPKLARAFLAEIEREA